MTNERSKDDSSENFPEKPCEVIGKLGIGFNKLNNKFINLLEENQRIKQQYKNLEEKNQEILCINSDLNEKYEEVSEKLQKRDEQIEKLQQHILNL